MLPFFFVKKFGILKLFPTFEVIEPSKILSLRANSVVTGLLFFYVHT